MVLDFGQISVLRCFLLLFFKGKMWPWEKSESFDLQLQELQDNEIEIPMTWVDCYRNPVKVSGEVTCDHDRLQRMWKGELIGDMFELLFCDPNHFWAGIIILNIGSTLHRKALLRSKHRFLDG